MGASNISDLMTFLPLSCDVADGLLTGDGSPKLTILGALCGTPCASYSSSSAPTEGCLAVLKSGACKKANCAGLKLLGTDGVLWIVGGLW
jgi:hypothetical protein